MSACRIHTAIISYHGWIVQSWVVAFRRTYLVKVYAGVRATVRERYGNLFLIPYIPY